MIAEGSNESGKRPGGENDDREKEQERRRKRKEREEGGMEREKKKRIALRSASRCRVHRFCLPSATLVGHFDPCTDIYIHAYTHIQPPNIAKRSVKGHADVHACQIIICNCRVG